MQPQNGPSNMSSRSIQNQNGQQINQPQYQNSQINNYSNPQNSNPSRIPREINVPYENAQYFPSSNENHIKYISSNSNQMNYNTNNTQNNNFNSNLSNNPNNNNNINNNQVLSNPMYHSNIQYDSKQPPQVPNLILPSIEEIQQKPKFNLKKGLYCSYLMYSCAYTAALVVLSTLIFAWQFQAPMSYKYVKRNWTQGVITDILATKDPQCPTNYFSLINYPFQGTVQGCDCRVIQDADGTQLNVDQSVFSSFCSANQIQAGCLTISNKGMGSLIYWATNSFPQVLLCEKRNFQYNFIPMGQRENVLCSAGETLCGGSDPETKVCVPSSENCPINYISFTQPPATEQFIEAIQIDGQDVLYISRVVNAPPISEIKVTQGNGVCSNIDVVNAPTETVFNKLLKNTYTACSSVDNRFSRGASLGQTYFYNANGITSNPITKISNKRININNDLSGSAFGLYYRSYMRWNINCRGTLFNQIMDYESEQSLVVVDGIVWMFGLSITLYVLAGFVYVLMGFFKSWGCKCDCLFGSNEGQQRSLMICRLILKILVFSSLTILILILFGLSTSHYYTFKEIVSNQCSDMITNFEFKDMKNKFYDNYYSMLIANFSIILFSTLIEIIALIVACGKVVKQTGSKNPALQYAIQSQRDASSSSSHHIVSSSKQTSNYNTTNSLANHNFNHPASLKANPIIYQQNEYYSGGGGGVEQLPMNGNGVAERVNSEHSHFQTENNLLGRIEQSQIVGDHQNQENSRIQQHQSFDQMLSHTANSNNQPEQLQTPNKRVIKYEDRYQIHDPQNIRNDANPSPIPPNFQSQFQEQTQRSQNNSYINNVSENKSARSYNQGSVIQNDDFQNLRAPTTPKVQQYISDNFYSGGFEQPSYVPNVPQTQYNPYTQPMQPVENSQDIVHSSNIRHMENNSRNFVPISHDPPGYQQRSNNFGYYPQERVPLSPAVGNQNIPVIQHSSINNFVSPNNPSHIKNMNSNNSNYNNNNINNNPNEFAPINNSSNNRPDYLNNINFSINPPSSQVNYEMARVQGGRPVQNFQRITTMPFDQNQNPQFEDSFDDQELPKYQGRVNNIQSQRDQRNNSFE